MANELIAIISIVVMVVFSIVFTKILGKFKKDINNESHNIIEMFRLENNSDVVLKLVAYHTEHGIVRYKVNTHENS